MQMSQRCPQTSFLCNKEPTGENLYASVLEQLADLKLSICLRSPQLREIQENKPLEFLRMRL